MLIKCPECGKRISDKVEACPFCGAPQPASLRVAALEQRRLARRKAIRITATVLTGVILLAAIAFLTLYRWPISYEVGTVTGTDSISREDLVKAVDDAAATWNSAAGRTIAWRLPLGKRVRFDIKFDASLQEYLTTLAGLEQDEADLYIAKNRADSNALYTQMVYDYWYAQLPPVAASTPTTHKIDLSDYYGLVSPTDPLWANRNPTLEEVETYQQRAKSADMLWTSARDRLDAFRKSLSYTGEPDNIDTGVIRTGVSPSVITLTCLPNPHTLPTQYILDKIVVHQFGHVLLGTWGANDSPSTVTATPLKSPWKLHFFGVTSP